MNRLLVVLAVVAASLAGGSVAAHDNTPHCGVPDPATGEQLCSLVVMPEDTWLTLAIYLHPDLAQPDIDVFAAQLAQANGSAVTADPGHGHLGLRVPTYQPAPAPTTTVPTATTTTPAPTTTVPAPTTTVPPTTTTRPPTTTTAPPPTTTTPAPTTTTPKPSTFPDHTTTGHRGTLTPRAGGSIRIANTVIANAEVNGCLSIEAANVVIRNSLIRCTFAFGVFARNVGLVIEDTTFDCGQTATTAIAGTAYTVRRVDIHGCTNGFDVSGGVLIEDSYVHDDYHGGASHADAIQMSGGSNITIRHNSLFTNVGSSAIISAQSGHSTVLIENNQLGGGSYAIYCPRVESNGFRVINNTFSRLIYPKSGEFGPQVYCNQIAQFSGNVWDNGLPVNA